MSAGKISIAVASALTLLAGSGWLITPSAYGAGGDPRPPAPPPAGDLESEYLGVRPPQVGGWNVWPPLPPLQTWSPANKTSGDIATGNAATAQPPPGAAVMSPEFCQALIASFEPQWQNYSNWSRYRSNRGDHWNWDGLALASANLKLFSQQFSPEERKEINDFLSGESGTVQTITQSLDEANTRIATLLSEKEPGMSEVYRVHFKILSHPRSISMLAGGRSRYDFDYVNMTKKPKRYVPLAIPIGMVDDEHPEIELKKERQAIEAAGENQLKKNIADTAPDLLLYANEKDYMIGQKALPPQCYEKPVPVAVAPVSSERTDKEMEDLRRMNDFMDRFDRPTHSGSGRASPH